MVRRVWVWCLFTPRKHGAWEAKEPMPLVCEQSLCRVRIERRVRSDLLPLCLETPWPAAGLPSRARPF